MNQEIANKLIKEQFRLAENLNVSALSSAGSDNWIFLIGENLVARFPKNKSAENQLEKEMLWLPVITESVSLPIPKPCFMGVPTSGFPFKWAIFTWINGCIFDPSLFKNSDRAVSTMAEFILSLWRIDIENAPLPGRHNNFRGQSLMEKDQQTVEGIENMPSSYDKKILHLIWEEASREGKWDKPPVWIHGDLHWANIITEKEGINGIIDFGTLGVGDPAVDIMCAWILFSPEKRILFKEKLNIDDRTWRRAMGWALSFSVIALPYYLPKKHLLADIAVFTLDNVIADFTKYN